MKIRSKIPVISNGFLYKKYYKSKLFGSDLYIRERILKINSFDYKNNASLVYTKIIDFGCYYLYMQSIVDIKKIAKIEKDEFIDLCDSLEYLDEIKFVHGDLNRKNIIYTKYGFRIVDYEPSINQVIDGINKLMVTPPYISNIDLNNKCITVRTDKIGFYYFVLRVNKHLTSDDVVMLSRNRDHYSFIKMNELEFENISYRDILYLAYEHMCF